MVQSLNFAPNNHSISQNYSSRIMSIKILPLIHLSDLRINQSSYVAESASISKPLLGKRLPSFYSAFNDVLNGDQVP